MSLSGIFGSFLYYTGDELVLLAAFLVVQIFAFILLPYTRTGAPFLWRLFCSVARFGEQKLNRERRAAVERAMRGIFVAVFFAGMGILTGAFLNKTAFFLAGLFHPLVGFIVLAIVLVLVLNPVSPLALLFYTHRFLKKGKTAEAARFLSQQIDAPLDQKDPHRLARRGMEQAALTLNSYIVAPLFWFVTGGVVMVSLYMSVFALGYIVAAGNSRYDIFGWAGRKLLWLMDFVPAHITGVLIALAAGFVAGCRPLMAFRVAFTQAGKYGDLNQGFIIGALAGALQITLSGAEAGYGNRQWQRDWIGLPDSTARVPVSDVKRCLILLGVCILMLVAGVSVIGVRTFL